MSVIVMLDRRGTSFTNSHPVLAGFAWLLTAQYFVAQVISALAQHDPYDWLHNSVSDLGVGSTSLTVFFNVSLIVVGGAVILGSVLAHACLRPGLRGLSAFGCLALGGIGTIMIGLFPSDTLDPLHHAGAAMALLGGSAGIILLCATPDALPGPLRAGTICIAVASVVGLVLVGLYFFFGIGLKGLAERFASYPESLWFLVFGLYLAISGATNISLAAHSQYAAATTFRDRPAAPQ